MAREYHYTWTWDFEASPEALWPFVSDTNRFNRDTGQPRMKLLGVRDGIRRVRWQIPLVPLEWEEGPFDWSYPSRFGILRRFYRGPLAEMRVAVDLARTPAGGTHLTYQVWTTPSNLIGRLAIPAAIGILAARRFDRAFRAYAARARLEPSAPDPESGSRLSAAGRARLDGLAARILLDGGDPEITRRLAAFVACSDELSAQRLRPYALADRWGAARRTTLETFLRAARQGMLDMYWELLCPECRGVAEGFGRLSQMHARSHCKTCNVDFSVNFDHNVEVIFRPNPAVRRIDAAVEFCVGSPQRQPHVVMNLPLAPGRETSVQAQLQPGRYSLRSPGVPGQLTVAAAEGAASAAELRLSERGWPYAEQVVATGASLTLVNASASPRTFELARTAWSDQAVTAANVITLQVFRDLFSTEVLRPGEEISVGSVTLVFTDLRESTRLYRQMGDAPAFGRVREHFAALAGCVAAQGGAVVKTMGDSVMAAFPNPAAALQAIWEAQQQIASGGSPPLWLKAGIHTGSCIVVSQNERLDYFGSTVNIAARLPGFSAGGEVVFSQPVHADPEAARLLERIARPNSLTPFQAPVKGYEAPFDLWRLRL